MANPLDIIDGAQKVIFGIIDRVFPNPKDAAEAKMKYEEMRQSGEIHELDKEIEDRANARNREIEMAKSGHRDLITPGIAIFVTIGFYLLLIATMIFPIPASMQQTMQYLISTAAAGWLMVISYYFGSSSSSRKQGNIPDEHEIPRKK